MAEIIDILHDNWVQISVIAFMAIMLICGYYRGLVRMSSNIVSLVISMAVTRNVKPYVQEWIKGNQYINNFIHYKVQEIISDNINTTASSVQMQDEINKGSSFVSKILGFVGNPEQLNTDTLYDLIGLDKIVNGIAEQVTEFVLSVITFVLLLIVITILVKLLFKILDKIADLPVLTVFNRVSGSLLGLVESVLYVWIIFIVLNILPKWTIVISALEQINKSGTWLYVLKEANIFMAIFKMMIN